MSYSSQVNPFNSAISDQDFPCFDGKSPGLGPEYLNKKKSTIRKGISKTEINQNPLDKLVKTTRLAYYAAKIQSGIGRARMVGDLKHIS